MNIDAALAAFEAIANMAADNMQAVLDSTDMLIEAVSIYISFYRI